MNIKYYKLSEFVKLTNSSIKDLKRWERLHLLIPIYKHNRRYYTKQHAIQLRRLHIYYPVLMTHKVNSPYKDLTGLQFTYLSVIKRVDDIIDNNGHRHIQQVHDDLKYKFAESHNIPIYYVPYTYIKPSDTYTLLDNLLKL